jgi:arginyl-tRNA synthetase
MKNEAQHAILTNLIDALAAATGLTVEQAAAQLSTPPKPEMGDYAFPCFAYAKANKLPPPQAAQAVGEKLKADPKLADVLQSVETTGAFLNVRVKPGALCKSIITAVRETKGHFGEGREGAGKTIIIDFSSPNIAKPFHVGHLMSTVLGASLVKIFRSLGYKVVGVNHLGDWGVQCGFQFLAWQREKEKFAKNQAADPEKELADKGLDYLADLYVGINQDAKLDPTLDTQARTLFKKLEDGDAELKALWEKLRAATLKQLQKSYDRLDVKFDSDAGEGFYEPMLKPLLEDVKTLKVASESKGALVVSMDETDPKTGKVKEKVPFILLKEDGATIYGTRDLAAVLYRKKTYDFAQNLYVVDVRQSDHFRDLFKSAIKIGEALKKPENANVHLQFIDRASASSADVWGKDCAHVAFGLMSIKEGDDVVAMSTRGGRMVPLGDLLDKMVDVVKGIIKEKNPELSAEKANEAAEIVGVGAIVFWIQARRRASNFVFDWKQATDPQGDTGPYLQYSYARACGIFRKAGISREQLPNANLELLVEPEEVAVLRKVEAFPHVLRQAAKDYEPSLVATWALELAGAFSHFLNRHRVIDSAPELKLARMALVDTVRETLSRGLAMIGVKSPEEM